jgi:MFS family permease
MHVGTLFHSARPVPAAYRASFLHLYFEIAWFGVLAASTLAFTAVYAARLGASAFHLGLLSAGPAVVGLFITLPAGRWLERQKIDSAVFWSAVVYRVFYLLWVPLPLLLAPQGQVWGFIGMTLVMSIPGASLAVGFNALFAEVVPPDWRGHVTGIRNALLAIAFIAVSVLCGEVLDALPFPTGYQVVFAIGFVGAAMSTFHLWFVAPRPGGRNWPRLGRSLGDLAWPGRFRAGIDGLRTGVALRFLISRKKLHLPGRELLGQPFAILMAVLLAFYLTIYLAIPLFPIHWVNQLHLSDREIGWGTAAFYVSVLVGSTQLDRLVRRLGNRRVTAIGAILMSGYPAFMSWARGLELFMVASVLGGLGWALVGGALINYVLEKVPADHRPGYLAWYNLALNAALLIGSLVGPLVADSLGVPLALMLFAVLRFLAALAIWRWA